MVVTFEQAFSNFIAAFEFYEELQDRCRAGVSVDLAEIAYRRILVIRAGEKMGRIALFSAWQPWR
jgi:hypothetical protein